jgi:diguanylate cyclase (GGDEF)-like protein
VAVAQLISANIRETDVVIRYGGEEFAVILANADEVIALTVAERIRAAIDDAGLPHEAAARGRVTVSIGVASGNPDEGAASPLTTEEVVDRARSADAP